MSSDPIIEKIGRGGRRKKEVEEEEMMTYSKYVIKCMQEEIHPKVNLPLIVAMRLSRSPSADAAASASSGMSAALALALPSLRHFCARTALFRFSSRF
jgi:hypothetical protein